MKPTPLLFLLFGILFLVFFISLGALQYVTVTQVSTNNSAEDIPIQQNVTYKQSVKEKFNEIVAIPYVIDLGPTKSESEVYRRNQGDCDDKSLIFCNFLYKEEYSNIKVVKVDGVSKSCSHVFVLFDNGVYDLCPPKIKYNWTKLEAKDYFERKGYDSWVEYNYYPGMWGT